MPLAALLAMTMQFGPATTMRLPVADAETLQITMHGAGAPVVLLPGLFGSAYSYRHVVPALVDSGYRTVVIEPLGMGTSSRPAGHDYSLTTQADRIGAVLDSFGLRNAIIVAHSTSASIAMRLAIRRPELVRGILSIDGGPAEDAAMPGFRRIMRFAPLLRLFATRGRMEKMFHDNFIKSSGDTTWVSPDVVRGYASGATANPGATLDGFRGMANSPERQRLAGNLGRIGVPMLVLVGGAPHSGGVGPDELAQLAAAVPVFAADTVPGAGHFLMEERPDVVIAGVRRISQWR